MSDLFRAVQEALRTHKARGVDLNNPMGVEIFGKMYPATKKAIMAVEGRAGFNERGPSASYSIPMENGLMISGHIGKMVIANEGESNRLSHHLFQPNINLSENNPEFRYGWTLARSNLVNNEYNIDTEHLINFDKDDLPERQLSFHETVKEWSKRPSHGLNHRDGTSFTNMSSEDHREHQHNVKSYHLATHPSKITVTHARSHLKPILVYYQYDINTEALTPWSWRDKYPDDDHRDGS